MDLFWSSIGAFVNPKMAAVKIVVDMVNIRLESDG
jgi:hypothetical protein